MKFPTLTATLLPLCLLASCATMQTHKNVRLSGIHFKGQAIHQPNQVFLSQGQWYLPASPTRLEKHFPSVDDPIFFGQEEPTFSPTETCYLAKCYLPISAGTAKILQDPQGYASLPVLQKEIEKRLAASPSHSLIKDSLPHSQSFPVRAQFEPSTSPSIITDGKMSHQPGVANQFLAGLDLVFIDVPGTLIYNIAIPFMAPVYFFKNIINDFDKDPFDQ
ncbi:MAG: hypothetical protein R3Y56_04420 [Akkermansia sp.]